MSGYWPNGKSLTRVGVKTSPELADERIYRAEDGDKEEIFNIF
jgi:hypothetical protein